MGGISIPTATARLWLVGVSALLLAGRGQCDDAAQADPSFRGYWVDGDTTDTMMCNDGFTFRTTAVATATLARCCEVGVNPPNFVRGCEDDTLQWDNGDKEECPDDYSCITVTMFDTYLGESDTSRPRATDFLCGKDWPASSLYRALTDEASSSSSSAGTNAASSGPSATTTDTATDDDDQDDEDDDNEESSVNGGMIAGSVIGSIAGVALLGSVAFWFFIARHRKRSGHARMEDDDNGHSNLPPVPPKDYPVDYGIRGAGTVNRSATWTTQGSGYPGTFGQGNGGLNRAHTYASSDAVSSPDGAITSPGHTYASPASTVQSNKMLPGQAQQSPKKSAVRVEVFEMPGSPPAIEMAANEIVGSRDRGRLDKEENWLHNP